MKAVRIVRYLFVAAALALFSCGQTVTPSRPPWMPPPGMQYSTLHGIWRVDCRFREVQHLHGRMFDPNVNAHGNLYLNTWLQIQQIGPADFRFGIGAIPGISSRNEGGLFWLGLSAANGSISGAEQLVTATPFIRETLVSASGTYTERTLNLVFLWQVEEYQYASGYIEQGTCTATRDHDW